MIAFDRIYSNRQEKFKLRTAPARLLSFDPGGTTGIALFHSIQLAEALQLSTDDQAKALKVLTALFARTRPTEVVMEDYRVYASKMEQHVGSSLSTPRLIGLIETLCLQQGIPYHKQPASTSKQFVTDEKLKDWNFYKTGVRHARDAIRHGCYYILFPPKTLLSEQIVRGGGDASKNAGQHVG
jgi:hypothetical protein